MSTWKQRSSVLATPITHIAPDRRRACNRCGHILNNPRAETVHCKDCEGTLKFEAKVARLGFDMSTLADHEYAVLVGKGRRRRVEVRSELDEEASAA